MTNAQSNIANHKFPILIIGGGISGITAAVEAAETGYEVVLVEKLPYLGGRVIKFHEYFPKLCPPYCGLEINFKRIKNNPRINIHISTTVVSIDGKAGSYTVKLKKEAEFINSNCTACGKCAEVCPEDRPDELNYNMKQTKAAYLPHELAFPFQHQIDAQYCKGETCGKCKEVCEYDAIDLSAKETKFEISASSIVFAIGWKPYEAKKITHLNFGHHPDIITNVMFERLSAPNGPTNGKILRPSDGKEPATIVFIQCAGSRDQNHLAYCSSVCCSASLKHALISREKLPDTKVSIYYIDLRVSGRNEDFLNKVKADKDIELIKGKAGKIEIENNELYIIAEDIARGRKTRTKADMVVLATGIVPEGTDIDNINLDNEGFINAQNGIISCGCVHKPMDVSASLKDATGAALKAIQYKNSHHE